MQSARSSIPGGNGTSGYGAGGSQVPAAPAGGTALATRPGFAGTCNTTLIDWIQLVQLGHRDAVLTVRSEGGRRATLWCRSGNIIDASCDGLVGEDAVYRVLAWPTGQISLDFGAVDHRCAIDTPTTGLLLEAMVRKDEAGRKDAGAIEGFEAGATTIDVGPPRAALADARRRRWEWSLWAAGMALALALFGAALTKKRAPGRASGPTSHGAPEGIMVVPLDAPTAHSVNAGAPLPQRKPVAPPLRPAGPAAAPTRAPSPAVLVRHVKHGAPPIVQATKAAAPPPVIPASRRQPNIQIIDDRGPQVRIVDEYEAHVDVLE